MPAEATAILDVRTTPALAREEIVRRIREAVEGEVRVLSDRLLPEETPVEIPLIEAARRARPDARLYGSATLSDMALLERPAGREVRSRARASARTRPTSSCWRGEVLDGARFYHLRGSRSSGLQAA